MRTFGALKALAWWGRGSRQIGLARLAATLVVGAALLWLGGFLGFVHEIRTAPEAAVPQADGIVVLTGGAARLDVALDLLQRGLAERLLITGVHPQIQAQDLSSVTIGTPELFECCVDLGKSAINTIGNAAETAEWARGKSYGSLLIVTANYHMPRSLIEFEAAMPGMRLVAVPVMPPNLNLDTWWRSPASTSLLASEYTKYLFALIRHKL